MKQLFLALAMSAALSVQAQAPKGTPAQLAEKVFGYVLNDQADSLYTCLTRQLKLVISKEQMQGILAKTEEKYGKYKSHGPWEVREVSGSKTCVATVEFENGQLGALVVLDPSNFLMGVQIVPAQAIGKK